MDNNPFSVLNVDRQPSNKWTSVREFCFGSLTRTTLLGAGLLWLVTYFSFGGGHVEWNGVTGSQERSYGSFPAIVFHRDFEVLPDGSQKTVTWNFYLDTSRPLETVTFLAVVISLSFVFAFILYLFEIPKAQYRNRLG